MPINTYLKKTKVKILHIFSKIFNVFELKKIINKISGKNIIFLPTVDWKTPLYQRPQHLAINLSKYISIIYGTANYSHDSVWGIRKINKKILLTNLWRDVFRIKNDSLVFLLSTQQLIKINELEKITLRGGKIIYDYVDEIHQDISGSQEMEIFLAKRHKYIKESGCASLVLCVSKKLYDEMLEYYPKERVLLVPNGVDYDHFQIKKDKKNLPKDLKEIVEKKQPIIGYYGAMANWLDYELINNTAKNRPEWSFVFIGVDYNGGLKKLNQSLPNIYFLGTKDYKELPKYGVWFDITLIPFTKGEIAKSTSPLKMYEYMAMRKPIVATEDLIECHGYDGVFISKNKINDFEQKITQAIKSINDQKIIKALDKYARNNTWQKRAELIAKKIFEK